MDSNTSDPKSETLRRLEVTHREALALLAALEISPFEDEILEQKLLNAVYAERNSHRPTRSSRDFTHHQRRRTR